MSHAARRALPGFVRLSVRSVDHLFADISIQRYRRADNELGLRRPSRIASARALATQA
jgi:hypothetical protein